MSTDSPVEYMMKLLKMAVDAWVDFNSKKKQQLILEEIRNIGCLNQKEMITYMFKARNLHRKFRDAYSTKENVILAHEELINHLQDGIRSAIVRNCSWASNLFRIVANRDDIPQPRCGVKTIIGNTLENAKVVSLWGTMGYEEGESYNLTENSATLEVFKNSRQIFLQNDIPHAIVSEYYKNPRINSEKTKNYIKKVFPPYFYRKRISKDKDWQHCWTPEDKTVIYKSTLVTPIAFNCDDQAVFEREFTQQWLESVLDLEDNLSGHDMQNNLFCFGYFCADHPKANYFDEQRDLHIGYFIADFLYYYFYVYYIFTRLSHTYQKYRREFSGQTNHQEIALMK